MNVIKATIQNIESYRKTNKNPCKSYATEKAAELATSTLAEATANFFECTKPARYIVMYNEAWGRWVGAIDMTELMSRKEFAGGYLGFTSDWGFFSY